jgi:hypothetical protein
MSKPEWPPERYLQVWNILLFRDINIDTVFFMFIYFFGVKNGLDSNLALYFLDAWVLYSSGAVRAHWWCTFNNHLIFVVFGSVGTLCALHLDPATTLRFPPDSTWNWDIALTSDMVAWCWRKTRHTRPEREESIASTVWPWCLASKSETTFTASSCKLCKSPDSCV